MQFVGQLVDLQNEILEWKLCRPLQKQIQLPLRRVRTTVKHLKRLRHSIIEAYNHSYETVLRVAGAEVKLLDKLLNEGETSSDATRAEERGARTTAVREGVVFKKPVEEGSNNFDWDIILFHSPLTELVSPLNGEHKSILI